MPVEALGNFVRSEETAEFLDASARGEFLVRRCDLGHFSEPAAASCTTCLAHELTWTVASGKATLISWAVTPGADGGVGEGGSVLAIGQLEEGPWWWSCILDADPAELAVGAALRVAFERPANAEESLPVFRLAR